MSLNYDFHKAARILDSLSREDSRRLNAICDRIQQAEARLNIAAAPALERCMQHCEGICCRNIHLNQIIGVDDFVFLLTVEARRKRTMLACLQNEAIHSADCLFLQNGTGPCLFSSTAKPKVCICTFCTDDTAMKREIRDVKAAFNALTRFLMFRKAREWLRRLKALYEKTDGVLE